jgi:2-polyprenyl-6-methoxyphenol hydroxylase-like FAD-dependent oxidoreductase
MVVDTEVLIVGAGPVGLMAAGELARRGIAVRIVDKAPQRSPQSRALVIHARTLETLDLAGLADTFLARGYPSPGLNVGLGGRGRPISIDMRVLDTRYPFMLVMPQRQTENILADALKTHGAQTEWCSTLTGIEQTAEGVVATIQGGDGRQERVRAAYLLGCDGAHSSVRRLVNLAFEGEQLSALVLLGDVKVDRGFARTRITNFTSPRGFVSLLPFLGEYVRVFAVDFAHQDRTRDEELTLAELQDTVNAIAPQPVSFSDPTWLTRYLAPSRQVRTTRSGRVFLAGDAAHAHSPAGGQGMNTGLQDAANIGWKLALVLRGNAGAGLLDSYDAERHPVHTSVRHGTDRMFRTFVVRNRVLKSARDMAARVAVPSTPIQRRLAENLSGLAIGYRHAAKADAGLPRGALRAGDRVPDVELWTAEHGLVRLYEIMREPGYSLFVYAEAERIGAEVFDVFEATAGLGGLLRSNLVVNEGALDGSEIGAPVYVDVAGRFATKLGAVHASVLLARPDGYLAAHHVGGGGAAVLRALRSAKSRSALTS